MVDAPRRLRDAELIAESQRLRDQLLWLAGQLSAYVDDLRAEVARRTGVQEGEADGGE